MTDTNNGKISAHYTLGLIDGLIHDIEKQLRHLQIARGNVEQTIKSANTSEEM